jgi:hypothetical protein
MYDLSFIYNIGFDEIPSITNILRIWKDTQATNRYAGIPFKLTEGINGYSFHRGTASISGQFPFSDDL